ncbi:MAG: peptidoglycan-associated lipoprotein Pal [Alphaproteobacteria bacterium]|nr:peptidoglycan-associated lipoprotein Pal [Alphaproteobacteria bacterium]
MYVRILSLFAAVVLLAGCESASTSSQGAAGGGATTTLGQTAVAPVGPVPGSVDDMRVNVGDRVFYDYNRSDLKPESRAQIERWAAWLTRYPQRTVVIEGHCDERGTREFNLALGERRANAARQYLLSLGVAANRVTTISYGKERPTVAGNNEAAWSKNRRAVLDVRS